MPAPDASANGPKMAVVAVHYGTTDAEVRRTCLDVFNDSLKAIFPDAVFAEAFTSDVIIRRAHKMGLPAMTPAQVLDSLSRDGVRKVIIQCSTVLDGGETGIVREAAASHPEMDVRVGNPLLYSVADCFRLADILIRRYADAVHEGAQVLLIGHGTELPANAAYSQLDYILQSRGERNFHVAAIESYPGYDEAVARLEASGSRDVVLVPLMFVRSNHVNNDINGHWKNELEKAGYRVQTVSATFASMPETESIYMDHAREAAR